MNSLSWAFVGSLVLLVLARPLPAGAQCPGLPLDMSGTQVADCMEPILRASEIAPGLDLMGQSVAVAPPKCDGSSLPAHSSLNFTGFSANTSTSIWASRYKPDGVTTLFGSPVTISANMADGQINGEQCLGLLANIGNGLGFAGFVCEGKGTDRKFLCAVDLATGQCKIGTGWPIVNQYMGDAIKTYGGANANCGYYYHTPPDGSCHMYCRWFGGTITYLLDPLTGLVTLTLLSYIHGPATPLNDPANNDPASAITYIGTPLVWTGALPAGMAEDGEIGVAAKANQSYMSGSIRDFRLGL